MARKSRLKIRHKKYYLFVAIALSIVGVAMYFYNKNNVHPIKAHVPPCDHIRFASMPISPSDKLNDLNDIQLLHARKNGLGHPFSSNEEFEEKMDDYITRGDLIMITDNRFYQLKSLTHSLPYLIPEAVDMLNEIGFRFQERLKEKKYKNFKYRVTSVLRTHDTQSKLGLRNGNATAHSAHLYGTTVDISYKNFYNTETDTIESSYEAVQTLTKVLSEMRQECKLLVIRERKQACFHITVVVCKPQDF